MPSSNRTSSLASARLCEKEREHIAKLAHAAPVIDAFEHDILERELSRRFHSRIAAAGVKQLREREGLVDRHDLVPQLVGDGVQRDGEVDRAVPGELVDPGHDARRRQRDALLAVRQPVAMADDLCAMGTRGEWCAPAWQMQIACLQRFEHIAVVEQRLAHPHQHNVG